MNQAFYVFRNCFTGDISGGDMHTGGFCEWVHRRHPETPLSLVHAANDGQAAVYPEAQLVPNAVYRAPLSGNPTVLFVLRALFAWWRAPLQLDKRDVWLVAGSHFLPDVLPVYLRGRRSGVRRAVYIHHIIQDMPRPKNLNTLLANLQEKFCFWLIRRRFDKIITVNQAVLDSLRQRGFNQEILVSSNFVDTTVHPQPLRKKQFTLAFCGRMVAQKGVDDFLNVCEYLQAKLPAFTAVMIGVGPELERLKQTARKRNLPITFAGRSSDGDKFQLLADSQLFVFPSREEGWGIAIAEALTVGTPVLAYRLPVYKSIFGNHIHTIPLQNGRALPEAAEQILKAHNAKSYAAEQESVAKFAKRFKRDQVIAAEYKFLTEGMNG